MVAANPPVTNPGTAPTVQVTVPPLDEKLPPLVGAVADRKVKPEGIGSVTTTPLAATLL